MAATVKPIEAKSVHQIQSGQVIVDLCSVVKELVENSLDAAASAIEVRFKNNGLDEIEVQDNGAGIAPINYENLALKHYTSKLSTYSDLSSLHTFGFRGEALSSLCALSTFTVTTAQIDEAPKGHRLEFEVSGRLKATSVVACQKGTTATVQFLFEKLPVRRKELMKNIKREYGKVLGLLHAYACISINVKFTVKNAISKGKSMTVFATKANATTRENIANVYGAKTLSALLPLALDLNFEQSLTQTGRNEPSLRRVSVHGHISRPGFGEGRQTPDRQMFFVNGRPCGLPQIAKAINEVYKSFNVSQSPFVFADLQMDTNAYDVNVSPDKRTILLHDATALVERLKTSLNELFEGQDQTVPQSQVNTVKLPAFRPLHVQGESASNPLRRLASAAMPHVERSNSVEQELNNLAESDLNQQSNKLLHNHFGNIASTRKEDHDHPKSEKEVASMTKERERRAAKIANSLAKQASLIAGIDEYDGVCERSDCVDDDTESEQIHGVDDVQVRDFNARIAEQQARKHPRTEEEVEETPISSISSAFRSDELGVVPLVFDRKRPKRLEPEVATITIGDRTITRILGTQLSQRQDQASVRKFQMSDGKPLHPSNGVFAQGLQKFNALGTQSVYQVESDDDLDEDRDKEDEQHDDKEDRVEVVDGSSEAPSTDSDCGNDSAKISKARNTELDVSTDEESEYADEKKVKDAEEKRVAELIQKAERAATEQTKNSERRAAQALKGSRLKDAIVSLATDVDLDVDQIEAASKTHRALVDLARQQEVARNSQLGEISESVEERLSLTVAKTDFPNMHVVGQFNLGFILAVRHKHHNTSRMERDNQDELFIIDQHASDEKYNFERLQLETVVGNQRMVRPALLDLSAVEEEIIIDNTKALEKNGFVVDVDTTGDQEVGRRCQLVSLPLSREVVFGAKDLDELIHLLAESPMLNDSSPVPRPSKVRKMFAMRACRSSIMIGKTLSRKQMSTVIQHMGSIDKPWNCPHGRPTMRHLASLDKLEPILWEEGDGVYPSKSPISSGSKSASGIWRNYTNM